MQFLIGNAFDEIQECSVLCLEAVVKAFGNPVNIESCANPTSNVYDGKILFFLKSECEGLELLDKGIAGLIAVIAMLAASNGFSHFPLYPLPDLSLF